MKTILKTNLMLVLVLIMGLTATAQEEKEYSMSVGSDATLHISRMTCDLKIEGHSGNELLIVAHRFMPPPEEAEGLRSLYNNRTDNTGIGLYVEEVNGKIVVEPASKQAAKGDFTIKVPMGINLVIDYENPYAKDVYVENVSGEINIATLGGDIELVKITGPTVISTINGEVKADFAKFSQAGPSSIESIHGEIDISMPASAAASLKMGTIHGDVYTNFDIEFDKQEEGMKRIGGNRDFKGNINGGGAELSLSTINSIIYLRKK